MDGSPWSDSGAGITHRGAVSLVSGRSFVVSGPSGIIGEQVTDGLYLLDTRVLSQWRLALDGWEIDPLAFVPDGSFAGTFVARAEGEDLPDAPITVVQRRVVGNGMHEDLELRNHGPARRVVLRLHVGADLAGLFAVKSGASIGRPAVPSVADGATLVMRPAPPARSGVEVVIVRSSVPPSTPPGPAEGFAWTVDLGTGATWRTALDVSLVADGTEIGPAPSADGADHVTAPHRVQRWRRNAASLASPHHGLERSVLQALDDLGALRIVDPRHEDRVVIAAGAPWFMALFGRDALLSSWMALPFAQDLAHGVLTELAETQGVRVDPATEEQPGKIMHEVRFDPLSTDLLGGASTYYGTVDATPLFVMLTAELARWTGATSQIAALLPAVDRALSWIEDHGDLDGDGFVEYLRTRPTGLEHQGWKDSSDAIRHADGTLARPPIALCEVQGYVYAAYRGRASLARAFGEDPGVARSFEQRADELQHRFDRAFWLDDVGWYAVGLDEHKRPIASLTSNVGHLLWSGIVPRQRAARLAAHLRSPALSTGWGVRTLSADNPGYNPLSYHCGSVWPHDTAVAIAGLARYGFDDEAAALALGLIDAAAVDGGRLPELFGGFARDDIGAPVPYPSSCSPQAWAAASPLLIVRALLGLDPDVPAGRIDLRPRVPTAIAEIALGSVCIGDQLVDIRARGSWAEVSGTGLEVTVA